MLAGGIADVGRMSMSGIGADVDDTTRPALPLKISLKILGHHQGNGPTIDGEVCIDAVHSWQMYLESLLSNQLGIERFKDAACVVVDQDVHRSKLSLTSIKQQRYIHRIAEVSFVRG